MSLLLTLNRFHTLFQYFHSCLWTSNFWLGRNFGQVKLKFLQYRQPLIKVRYSSWSKKLILGILLIHSSSRFVYHLQLLFTLKQTVQPKNNLFFILLRQLWMNINHVTTVDALLLGIQSQGFLRLEFYIREQISYIGKINNKKLVTT